MLSKLGFGLVIIGTLGFSGWYLVKGPGSDVPNMVAPQAEKQKRPFFKPPSPMSYEGLSAHDWGQILVTGDRQSAQKACMALKVMGAEGRPHMLRGLDSPNPETRRLCLEQMPLADIRSFGETGKQTLIRLAGDPADIRIRERANTYLNQWSKTLPAR